MPATAEVLRKWAWQVVADGSMISRVDHRGAVRSWVLGVDGLERLKSWLKFEHKHKALHSTGRFRDSYHRTEVE